MSSTMHDLRREVATRARNSMHGREIDLMDSVEPQLPHMLGITPLGEEHDPQFEEMTLLDTRHEFWQSYEDDIRTRADAKEKLETAIRSLREDDIIRMTYPYGEEAEIVYVEVDKLSHEPELMRTDCRECGSLIPAEPNVVEERGCYYLRFSLNCPECEFHTTVGSMLCRVE